MILYPKIYLNNVKEITIELLNKNNVNGILLDVDNTLIDFNFKKCGEEEVAVLLNSLKLSYDMLKKQYPEIAKLAKCFKAVSTEVISSDKENIVDIPEEE